MSGAGLSGAGLYAKLAACIGACVLLGAALLSLRQARLQAAHELTRCRLRLIEIDEKLLAIRGDIALRSSPTALASGALSDEAAWLRADAGDVPIEPTPDADGSGAEAPENTDWDDTSLDAFASPGLPTEEPD